MPRPFRPFPQTKLQTYEGVAFLQDSERQLKDFANNKLGCNLDKGRDFVAKAGNVYVIGEAKFLTTYGGHQNTRFQDALQFLNGKQGKAVRVAVLDGVVWIENSTQMHRTVRELEETALTALL